MRHTLTLPHTRTVSRSLSLSVVRALHRCLRGLEHVCLACAVLLARSRFREILSNLRASGSRYQYAGDSRNFRETWDVWHAGVLVGEACLTQCLACNGTFETTLNSDIFQLQLQAVHIYSSACTQVKLVSITYNMLIVSDLCVLTTRHSRVVVQRVVLVSCQAASHLTQQVLPFTQTPSSSTGDTTILCLDFSS